MKQKNCKYCGNKFTPPQSFPLQQVCSNTCAYKLKDKRQKKKEKSSPPKRKPIANMSPRMKAEQAIYRPIRDQYMKKHPVCECCNHAESQDLHHKAGRTGYFDEDSRFKGLKLLWDVRFFMAVCRSCHNEIHHADPKWAREQGYLIPTEL